MKQSGRLLAILFAAAVFLPVPVSLSLADSNNQLEVKCVDGSGNAVPGVKVTLQQLENNKAKDKKSDAKGIALFQKLDDGSYRVIGRKEAMAPSFQEFFVLRNAAQQSVTLKFEAGAPDSKLYFEDPTVNQHAMELMRQALASFQANKMEEGAKLMDESLRINPSNPEGYFHLGTALVQMKQWDRAVAAYQKAADAATTVMQLPRPKDQAGSDALTQVQTLAATNAKKVPVFRLQTDAEDAAKERKFDVAVAKYQEAITLDPNDSYLHYAVSVALANAGKLDESDREIDKAIQLKPGEKAYTDMKQQISLRKENDRLRQAQNLLTEGDNFYKANDFANALKKYEEARPMIPDKSLPTVLAQIGRTYGKLNQPDKAVAAFNKAIEMAPDNAEIRRGLAQYYLNEKKYEDALNVFTDPRASANGAPEQVLFDLGQKLSSAGNSEVAELAFEKALKINSKHAESCYELGMLLYYAKKDDKRAIDLLTQYVQLGKDKAHIDNASTVLVVLKKRAGK
jgi:tetratricopeptide (TPR) repeat protein